VSRQRLDVGISYSDRVAPIIEGRVASDAVELVFESGRVDDIFWRALHSDTFDLMEMSLAAHSILVSRGDTRFVGLPIFTSRMFRHGSVYVPRGSPIRTPSQLSGKHVGLPEFQMTAAVWLRGIFAEFYGLDLTTVNWFAGGVDKPGRKERIPLNLRPEYRLTRIDESRTLGEMLVQGELDALISAKMPTAFREGGPVRRLFADPAGEEGAYFKRAGHLPIMHLCVLRREVYEENPQVVHAIYETFEEARQISLARLYDSDALTVMSPWLLYGVECAHETLGGDYWPYGVAKNERCLGTFLGYLRSQGLLERTIGVQDLFAKEFRG
jgi:4,5-dihydroxyphthalate decarboxylase